MSGSKSSKKSKACVKSGCPSSVSFSSASSSSASACSPSQSSSSSESKSRPFDISISQCCDSGRCNHSQPAPCPPPQYPQPAPPPPPPQYPPYFFPPSRSDAGEAVAFRAMVTPLSNLSTPSGSTGNVSFLMRRKNKTITIQWESFSGQLGGSGVSSLVVAQSICNLPPTIMEFPVRIIYNSAPLITFVEINPLTPDNIRFYLALSSDGSSTKLGDTIIVPSSAVTWITT